MTIAWNEDIIEDDTCILKFAPKTFLLSDEHFGTVLTEEIRIAKFCTEVFVIPKHLINQT